MDIVFTHKEMVFEQKKVIPEQKKIFIFGGAIWDNLDFSLRNIYVFDQTLSDSYKLILIFACCSVFLFLSSIETRVPNCPIENSVG